MAKYGHDQAGQKLDRTLTDCNRIENGRMDEYLENINPFCKPFSRTRVRGVLTLDERRVHLLTKQELT